MIDQSTYPAIVAGVVIAATFATAMLRDATSSRRRSADAAEISRLRTALYRARGACKRLRMIAEAKTAESADNFRSANARKRELDQTRAEIDDWSRANTALRIQLDEAHAGAEASVKHFNEVTARLEQEKRASENKLDLANAMVRAAEGKVYDLQKQIDEARIAARANGGLASELERKLEQNEKKLKDALHSVQELNAAFNQKIAELLSRDKFINNQRDLISKLERTINRQRDLIDRQSEKIKRLSPIWGGESGASDKADAISWSLGPLAPYRQHDDGAIPAHSDRNEIRTEAEALLDSLGLDKSLAQDAAIGLDAAAGGGTGGSRMIMTSVREGRLVHEDVTDEFYATPETLTPNLGQFEAKSSVRIEGCKATGPGTGEKPVDMSAMSDKA